MTTQISATNITHKFSENIVLNNISLEIKQGKIFGLLGPSGAGKTTLIKILTGQLTPTSGEAFILQKRTNNLTGNDYTKIGIMMDNFGLYERLNCYDNLKFFSKILGVPKSKIDMVLSDVGLQNHKQTPVIHLSKGMKNRLSFARALLGEPKILFLDEPTSGLDPKTVLEIHEMILKEKQKGTTIFLTTHNMQEAEKLCDRIALLNNGKIVESGNPKEICRRYNHQKKILVHLSNGTDLELLHDKASIITLANYFENNEVETIHSTEPNLETVFMELTGRNFT